MDVVINTCFGGFGLSDAACEWLAAKGLVLHDPSAYGNYVYDEFFSGRRNHLLLVECVRTLGSAANDSCADLQVAKGDGRFYIKNYDGKESVVYYDNGWSDAYGEDDD